MSFDEQFRALLLEAEATGLGMARGWCQHGSLRAYLRLGGRVFDSGGLKPCVQIASLEIADPAEQRKGAFSAMLACIQALSPLPIYVENVLNREFGEALVRRGFRLVRDDGLTFDLILH